MRENRRQAIVLIEQQPFNRCNTNTQQVIDVAYATKRCFAQLVTIRNVEIIKAKPATERNAMIRLFLCVRVRVYECMCMCVCVCQWMNYWTVFMSFRCLRVCACFCMRSTLCFFILKCDDQTSSNTYAEKLMAQKSSAQIKDHFL